MWVYVDSMHPVQREYIALCLCVHIVGHLVCPEWEDVGIHVVYPAVSYHTTLSLDLIPLTGVVIMHETKGVKRGFGWLDALDRWEFVIYIVDEVESMDAVVLEDRILM